MKLQINGHSYQISLPKALVLGKKWKVGDKLKIIINKNGNLEIMKDWDSEKNNKTRRLKK